MRLSNDIKNIIINSIDNYKIKKKYDKVIKELKKKIFLNKLKKIILKIISIIGNIYSIYQIIYIIYEKYDPDAHL